MVTCLVISSSRESLIRNESRLHARVILCRVVDEIKKPHHYVHNTQFLEVLLELSIRLNYTCPHDNMYKEGLHCVSSNSPVWDLRQPLHWHGYPKLARLLKRRTSGQTGTVFSFSSPRGKKGGSADLNARPLKPYESPPY